MKKARGSANLAISADYRRFVEELKARVAGAHLSAARRINHELIFLYWDIGSGIAARQKELGWGESVVEMVAADLRQAFPSMRGFSARNVWDMKRFFLAYSDEALWRQPVAKVTKSGKGSEILPQPAAELAKTKKLRQPVAELEGGRNWPQAVAKLGEGGDPGPFLPQLVAEIPWGHHRLILDKLSEPVTRLWYLRATAHFGWSRNVLLNQIKAGAYERAVTENKTHNFAFALPEHFAEQADEMLKSSYCLDFLGLHGAVKERELEDRLIARLQSFLLELRRTLANPFKHILEEEYEGRGGWSSIRRRDEYTGDDEILGIDEHVAEMAEVRPITEALNPDAGIQRVP